MFSKSNIKVKFLDHQLDDYVLENSVLQSKLQSKVEALSIMSNELDKCRMERDRYKVLVEQLKTKNVVTRNHETSINIYKQSYNNTISGGELLAKTREQNNLLNLEVETLRSKLEDTSGDINALRKQLQLFETNTTLKGNSILYENNKDYEELVQQLEKVQKKYQQIQLDYRATLDEKEELVADRDYYKTKVMRLNHQISFVLNNRSKSQIVDENQDVSKPVIDIDAMITENKYLHERITQLQVEKEIVKRTLTKYKSLLENRNKNTANNLKNGFLDVMTQKQVREFLDVNSKTGLKKSSAAELRCLCLGLFEALNDKSIALQHQRKTNQILANRITELEKTLESWCNGEKYIPIFPSQMLLDEYLPGSESPRSDDSKDKQPNRYPQKHGVRNVESDDEDCKKADDVSMSEMKNITNSNKIELPLTLQELVREALAEMKPIH